MSGYNRLGEYLYLSSRIQACTHCDCVARIAGYCAQRPFSKFPVAFLWATRSYISRLYASDLHSFAFLVARAFIRCISLSLLPYHTAHSPLIEDIHRRGPSVRDGSKTPGSRAHTLARTPACWLPARRQLWLARRAARDPHGTKHDASRSFRRQAASAAQCECLRR